MSGYVFEGWNGDNAKAATSKTVGKAGMADAIGAARAFAVSFPPVNKNGSIKVRRFTSGGYTTILEWRPAPAGAGMLRWEEVTK
jgi:hypothetical protein